MEHVTTHSNIPAPQVVSYSEYQRVLAELESAKQALQAKTYTRADKVQDRRQKDKQEILDSLYVSDRKLSADLAELTGLKRGRVAALLAEMKKSGHVKQVYVWTINVLSEAEPADGDD